MLFPLKHVLVFKWNYDVARSLDDVAKFLDEGYFYVVRPREDILVATSLSKPGLVVFIFLARNSGGDLILIQQPDGPYDYDHLVRYLWLLGRKAGVKFDLDFKRVD